MTKQCCGPPSHSVSSDSCGSGEICLTTCQSFDAARDFTPQDVAVDDIRNPSKIRVTLKHFKTDPFREGVEILIPKTNDEICPVAAMLVWLVTRGNHNGPLFTFQSHTPLMRNNFVASHKNALSLAGINPEKFSGHNFRIGAATASAKCGLSDSAIKQLGR